MNRYYITFGQSHTHRINGVTFDCDSLMIVRAESEEEARTVVRELTNNRYCTSYTQKRLDEDSDFMRHFSRGAIELDPEFR